MKELTIQVEKGGQKNTIIIMFSRSKLLSYARIEDFVRNTMGEDAKICNPELLKKSLERAKGGAQ